MGRRVAGFLPGLKHPFKSYSSNRQYHVHKCKWLVLLSSSRLLWELIPCLYGLRTPIFLEWKNTGIRYPQLPCRAGIAAERSLSQRSSGDGRPPVRSPRHRRPSGLLHAPRLRRCQEDTWRTAGALYGSTREGCFRLRNLVYSSSMTFLCVSKPRKV